MYFCTLKGAHNSQKSLWKSIKKKIFRLFRKIDLFSISLIVILTAVLAMVFFPYFDLSSDVEELSILQKYSYDLDEELFLKSVIPLLDEKRFILLGEATHGTQEFYEWRSILTKELIENGIIDFVAVEGDWDALFRVNRYVKGLDRDDDVNADQILSSFDRWPEWMWANEVFLDLIEWIREYNMEKELSERIGVYGVDVYGAANSFRELMSFVFRNEETLSQEIIDSGNSLFSCFSFFDYDFHNYASDVTPDLSCEDESKLFSDLILNRDLTKFDDSRLDDSRLENDEFVFDFLNAQIGSIIVKNAESHFRLMRDGGARSWNARAGSFAETMIELSSFYDDGVGVLWAHNTHVGDARYTSMVNSGSINVGQVLRENNEDEVFILGFGTYTGKVIAGTEWGSSPVVMEIPTSPSRSYEALFVSEGLEDLFFIFDRYPELDEILSDENRQRAIGVVYNPFFDNSRNQVDTILNRRYDAFIFIKETSALMI